MRMRNSALLHGLWLTLASPLVLPGEALADWGNDNWGAMMWSNIASPPVLPALGIVGLGVLAMGLAATAAWALRKRRPTFGLTLSLVLLAIPLAVAAGTLAVPNTFLNGTIADANQVNANFDAVETEVNDNDSRITAAKNTADAAVASAATAQNTANAAESAAASAATVNTDQSAEVAALQAQVTASVPFKGFSAYFSAAKSIATSGTPGALAGTWSKVEFDAEKFNPQNDYDTGNYRFTPQVAGFYNVSAALWFAQPGMFGRGIAIFKNGSVVNLPSAYAQAVTDGSYNRRSITRIVQMNGTSDYLEIYAYQTSGASTVMYPDGCFFSAHFIGE